MTNSRSPACLWSGWMWSEKRPSAIVGRLFAQRSRAWYQIQVMRNRDCCEERQRVFLYRFDDDTHTRTHIPACPTKIIVVDSTKPISRLSCKDRGGRPCISLGVKGCCGKLEGLKDGRLVLALESEQEAYQFLKCLHNLMPLTDEYGEMMHPPFVFEFSSPWPESVYRPSIMG
mmetsp:Transcript_66825/g.178645  ORF Transcript_66825/g.178645 Transcript_66825/m.178645 type:complete len:173 (+) Transcript_66825:135-653(+)